MIIHVAFCFDDNVFAPSCVAIASLLDRETNRDVHFGITCISSGICEEHKRCIEELVQRRDDASTVRFLEASTEFQDAHLHSRFTQDTYTPLLMHRLLPELDRVIYMDTDTLIQTSLSELWNIDMNDCSCAGVLGTVNLKSTWDELKTYPNAEDFAGVRGKYINDGVMLMNLKWIRNWNPDALFLQMSKKNYHYLEQDIFNITCKDHIRILHPKYNVYAYMTQKMYREMVAEGFLVEAECEEAFAHPAILHYAGPKPWNNRGAFRAKEWWSYVESQPDLKAMFNKQKVPRRKTTGLMGKINRHLPF